MNRTLARAIAGPLVLILSFTTAPLVCAQESGNPQAQAAPSQGTQPTPDQNQAPAQAPPQDQSPSTHQPPVELPENPGHGNANEPAPNAPASPTQPVQQQEPNGTAVAPQIQTSGGAASKPAGVAIAPPKQRRVRSLLIKLGVLAGAGVAIGTVVGLSAASPSHVPNSPGH